MDKTAIKNYAVEARKKLIKAVKLKAKQLYLFEDSRESITHEKALKLLEVDGVFFTPEQSRARLHLVSELTQQGESYDIETYNRMMENIAYIWFNRLISLRFMEVNNYLPSNIRILSSKEQGRIEPDALRDVELLDYVDKEKLTKLRANKDFNAPEKLYRHILIAQCNKLSEILPVTFQELDDYTELLLPDILFSADGIVHDLVSSIHEDNFNIKNQGQIEIIGWLYQYYTSEKKDEVFASLKKNVKLNKDTIPAATQLFTPEWIVKYMVENSLGRLWLERYPNQELRIGWRYYVDEVEQEPDVVAQLLQFRAETPIKRPEDIKLIDPCMGSGHILVYAFDVLYQIYESVGYSAKEIPNLILQHNIHGLDIDNRAGQLAYFALMMKARSYNRRFFRQAVVPQPMVHSAGGDLELSEYGSLVNVDELEEKPHLPDEYIFEHIDKLVSYKNKLLGWQYRRLLAQKYDIVITNPPYMMPAPLQTEWIKKTYPNSKSDLCVVFIERNFDLLKQSGYLSMITMQSWMFLSSYEKFRENLIKAKDIVNMVHLGARAFEEIVGEVVQTTAFVLRNLAIDGYLGTYLRLVNYAGQQEKENAFTKNENRYISGNDFSAVPGCTIAYSASKNLLKSFKYGELIDNISSTRQGIIPGNTEVFLRLWYEVSHFRIGFNHSENGDISKFGLKWFPYNKGGGFRRWNGNIEHVINMENDGFDIKYGGLNNNYRLREPEFYFKPAVTWTKITSSAFSARYMGAGHLFDIAGCCIFSLNENEEYVLGFCNSKVADTLLSIISPTLNYEVDHIKKLPILINNKDEVSAIVKENITISKIDWDSFETSWNFQVHPLIQHKVVEDFKEGDGTIEQAFSRWKIDTNRRFDLLRANEEELNRIFIEIYGLQDELAPEVEDKDVTVCKADLGRDIRSFISYAVGCMFGRYSLDELGLIFAGGKFDPERYKIFKPSDKNILVINTIDYFDDDIVLRFTDFVRIVYGENTLDDNLNFIANILYPTANGTSRERIRRYFLNDFYKDHVKMYQKRPIYWLMDSGKKDGFKAFFYLHRYDKYTIARARTEYLLPLQRKYDAEIKRIESQISGTSEARIKTNCRKQITALQARFDECRAYDQVVAYISYQNIELDLDDGVKVNYAKFQGVEVPMDNGKVESMNLLGRI